MKTTILAALIYCLIVSISPMMAGNSTTAKDPTSTKQKNKNSSSVTSNPSRSSSAPVRNETQTTPDNSNPQSGERIDWDVLASAGGNEDSSTNFRLGGTLGQTAVGEMTSTNFILSGGFWQNFTAPAAYLCGDADASGKINVADAVFVINYIFASGAAPDPLARFDNDCNAKVNVADIVYLINYIFASGPAPCASCK
jgi:hypothetical protein